MSTPAKRLPDHEIASFETLYSSELPVVFGFLRIRAAGDVALAEDLTALVLLSAVEQFQAGRGDVVTRNWLLTSASLTRVDRTFATVRGVILRDAKLSQMQLIQLDFTGADFAGLQVAADWSRVICPDGSAQGVQETVPCGIRE